MTFDDRVQAAAKFGFTERQARFLVTVMLHSGVCLPRQYAAFAGRAYGHTASDFFARLVSRRHASASECLHNRARVYHVHHRPLYRAIGEPEIAHRRPLAASRVVERLMLLDTVLDSPETVWLATTEEKLATLTTLTGIPQDRLPQAPVFNASSRTVRLFPDRLPIGIHPEGRAVLVFPVTEASTTELRVFLQRHLGLLHGLPAWTLRLVMPPHLSAGETLQKVVRQELGAPLGKVVSDELRWYFEQRKAAAGTAGARPDAARYARARRAFQSPRFEGLYRAWTWQGDPVLERVASPALSMALASGAGQVECQVLTHRYQHLSPLVAGVGRRSRRVEKGEHPPTPPRPPIGLRPWEVDVSSNSAQTGPV
jgi:hypothetical protein